MKDYWRNVSFSGGSAVVLYALLMLAGLIPAESTAPDEIVLLILACALAGCLFYHVADRARLPFPAGLLISASGGGILLYAVLSKMLPAFSGTRPVLPCILIAAGAAAAAAAAGRLTSSIDAEKINLQLDRLHQKGNREEHEQDY